MDVAWKADSKKPKRTKFVAAKEPALARQIVELLRSSINAAEATCDCADESCGKARSAMRDLRALVSDLDWTIRNGWDASDFVQRQERIDEKVNEAAQFARDGK